MLNFSFVVFEYKHHVKVLQMELKSTGKQQDLVIDSQWFFFSILQ